MLGWECVCVRAHSARKEFLETVGRQRFLPPVLVVKVASFAVNLLLQSLAGFSFAGRLTLPLHLFSTSSLSFPSSLAFRLFSSAVCLCHQRLRLKPSSHACVSELCVSVFSCAAFLSCHQAETASFFPCLRL